MGPVRSGVGKVAQEEDKIMSPRFTITDRIAAALTKIERARGFLEAAKLSEDWVIQMANGVSWRPITPRTSRERA